MSPLWSGPEGLSYSCSYCPQEAFWRRINAERQHTLVPALNPAQRGREILHCNEPASSLFAESVLALMVSEKTVPGFHVCDMLCFIACCPVWDKDDDYHASATFSPTRVQNSFLCDANSVLRCTPAESCAASSGHWQHVLLQHPMWPWHQVGWHDTELHEGALPLPPVSAVAELAGGRVSASRGGPWPVFLSLAALCLWAHTTTARLTRLDSALRQPGAANPGDSGDTRCNHGFSRIYTLCGSTCGIPCSGGKYGNLYRKKPLKISLSP